MTFNQNFGDEIVLHLPFAVIDWFPFSNPDQASQILARIPHEFPVGHLVNRFVREHLRSDLKKKADDDQNSILWVEKEVVG